MVDHDSALADELAIRRAADTAQANAARVRSTGPTLLALDERIARVIANPPTVSVSDEYRTAVEKRELQERADLAQKQSGVPTHYRTAAPEDLAGLPADQQGAFGGKLERVQALARRPGIIGLVGPRGTGKTWIACAVVNAACRVGRRARYCDAMDFFLELKATYGDKAKEDQTAVEARYLAPPLLVLDEMHERGDTAWEDRMLTRLVNKRYAEDKVTILISNDEPEAFAARVGTSIADRINDGGGIIVCRWASLRGKLGTSRAQE
jgi:DNA replication protein DnaC